MSGIRLSQIGHLELIDNLIDTTLARYDRVPRRRLGQQRRRLIDYDDVIEHGATEGERSDLFQACVWHRAGQGKGVDQIVAEFARYPNGIGLKYADRLQQEVERSFRKWEREGNQRDRGEAFEVVCLADVEAKPVDWLWPLRLARGKVTILSGDPGMGKSQIALDTAARITIGDCWADSDERSPVGNVVIFSAEDALDDTVVPRLGAAGGDVQRVHAVKMVTDRDGKRRAVNLRADLDKLRALVEEIGNVLLVIIDPISAYLGDSIDSKQTFSVNPVLMMVADFADQARCAVFVVHHPPKETPKKAISCVIGFAGVRGRTTGGAGGGAGSTGRSQSAADGEMHRRRRVAADHRLPGGRRQLSAPLRHQHDRMG